MSTTKTRLHRCIASAFFHPDYTVGIEIASILPSTGSRTITAGHELKVSSLTLPQRLFPYVIVYMIACHRKNFKAKIIWSDPLPFTSKYDIIFQYLFEVCNVYAPVAQGIERRSPEPGAQVRILLGAPSKQAVSQQCEAAYFLLCRLFLPLITIKLRKNQCNYIKPL